MPSHKLIVKFFAEGGFPGHDAIVPVFHSWIQNHAIPDHLLIDVADYHHVQNGPGVVLVAHEGNFSTDQTDGRPGLMYQRKTPAGPTLADNLRAAFAAAQNAIKLMESDPTLAGRLRFSTREILFRIADRLNAPNSAETFAAVSPELGMIVTTIFGVGANLSHQPRSDQLFEVKILVP